MYTSTSSKRVPNTSSFIMLEKNNASFIIHAAVQSSASKVDWAVSLCNPNLKLTASFKRNAR